MSRWARGLRLSAALVGLLAASAGVARAQPRPWAPAGFDSTRLWGLEAHALLDATTNDSIGPDESRAFGLLDRMLRRYFLALGSHGMRGAKGILGLADSLKLDIEIAQDPVLPQFVVATYFNTKFAGYGCWTTLFWWRGDDLMKQSILLQGGRNVQMDTWWTGNELGPYEMAIVDYRRSGDPREGFFTMLRISRQAEFWGAVQSENRRPIDLGGPGPSQFVDLDNDGVPEFIHWATSQPDPRFVKNTNLPPILSERTWRRTEEGFQLLDRRTVPTPFSTFVLFLRALENGEAGIARSLVTTPALYVKAQSLLKLGTFRAPSSWRAAEPAPGTRWAETMRFEYGQPPRLDKALDVRMKEIEGHWLVDGLTSLGSGAPTAPAPKANARGRR
jgi:hypothetical protein